ncbi:MAG TPA: glycosyltransferase [Dermatophilaceae bacterium]|nr:glycosyltransferase [Dermatophilaceae bacterium]
MSSTCKVAVVLSGWPRVSEVFAVNELVALHRAGMLGPVFALKPGDGRAPHPAIAEVAPYVRLLPPAPPAALAATVARQLDGTGVAAVHGYFAHDPARVAADAADLLGLPFGFSTHALDARKTPPAELAGRARRARLVLACNGDVAGVIARAGRVPELVPHGVDLDAFAVSPVREGDPAPVRLLAVGRLVEKKGFDVLVAAVRSIRRDVRVRIVGTGPLHDRLAEQIRAAGLADRVQLAGRQTHATLPVAYAAADIVVVPSVTDRDGDRDGLPNVVLEAMASGRPVVASDLAAIPAAVQDGTTGLLVPAGDPGALAEALTTLIDDPGLRASMGWAGRKVVEADYDLTPCAAGFCAALERAYA